MDVSVIIVNWNVRELLLQCLRSLMQSKTRYRFEIIVVDNASTDGCVPAMQDEFPHVRCIALPTNKGFAFANNRGIEVSSGRHIFILNPDCEVFPDTLEQGVSYLDANAMVSILAPRIVNPDRSFQAGSVRKDPTLMSQVLVLLKLQRLIIRWGLPSAYYQSSFNDAVEQDVEQAMGAALLIRRTALQLPHAFDERFFLWFEEVDVCKRIRAAGGSIRFVPRAEVMHRGGESFSQQTPLRRNVVYSSSVLRYFKKHHSLLAWIVLLLLVPFSLGLTVVYQLVSYAKQPTRH